MFIELCKSSLLLLACGSLLAINQAPQPPPTEKDKIHRRGFVEHGITIWLLSCAAGYTAFTIFPAAVIIATLSSDKYASHAYHALCPHPTTTTAITSLTPTFLAGLALLASGAALRLWCYRTLGRFFTFQLAIKQGHSLVTSGPYAWARHPSYSGVFMLWGGIALISFGRGGYATECGLMHTPARWAVYTWFAMVATMVVGAFKRTGVEDTLLRDAFGEVWVKYAMRVPYKFMPGVY